MKKTSVLAIAIFLLLQLLLVRASAQVSHTLNFIDSIASAKQITDIIGKANDRYKDFKVNVNLDFVYSSDKRNTDSLKIKPWLKADFDHNGLTDLLVVGTLGGDAVLCVLDKGDHYQIIPITRRTFSRSSFPVVENGRITYYYKSPAGSNVVETSTQKKFSKIILVYKFGDFIEENLEAVDHRIEKIQFSTSSCYGPCPIFRLAIKSDRRAQWFAKSNNEISKKYFQGSYLTKVAQNNFDELVDLLNYIDFPNLKENYEVNWTDVQTSTLRITYDGGKVKLIKDYGLIGTYGLDRFYEMMFDLRKNQIWKKQELLFNIDKEFE